MTYLFSRSLRVSGNLLESMSWSARITEKVNQIAEQKFELWTPIMSPQINTLAWTTTVDDLAALTATDEKLMADSGYLELVAEGNKFNAGSGVDDSLDELVYMDPSAGESAAFATVVTAVVAPGSFVEGVTLGVEIAQRASATTGRPVLFARASTGVYGQVSWIGLYDSIEQVQASDAALGADLDFAKLIDEKASRAYLAGHTTQSIARKVM